MNPGELDTQITIQAPRNIKRGDGSVDTIWETYATVWSKAVAAVGARSQEAAAANRWTDPHVFTIRYDSGISTLQRLVHDGQVYAIVGWGEEPNTSRRSYLRLIASRLDPQPAVLNAGPTP